MDGWYYREPSGTEDDDDPIVGPVPLDRVVQLLRSGALVDDVPVSVDGVNWRPADEVADVRKGLPLDRERLIREFIEYGEAAGGEETLEVGERSNVRDPGRRIRACRDAHQRIDRAGPFRTVVAIFAAGLWKIPPDDQSCVGQRGVLPQ